MKRYFNQPDDKKEGDGSGPKKKQLVKNKNSFKYKKPEPKSFEGNSDVSNDAISGEVVTVANLKPRRVRGGRNVHSSTKVSLPEEKILRYSRGEKVDSKGVRGQFHKKRLERKETLIEFSAEQAARTELLLTEESGYLIPEDGEDTAGILQSEIVKEVDITNAAKHFELQLYQFGPYRLNYSRNGRYLLLGGKKGHVAAMDWVTKKLMCEINVMESIHDVRWLHTETMYAVAQRSWTYIYDNRGIELHCLKRMDRVTRLEFLPFHFLLTSCSDLGFLTWLDISVGKIVSQFNALKGRLNLMVQNPQNALMCVGHSKGVVTMWSPNSREPLVSMLCHKAPLQSLAVHPSGNYMVTAAADRTLAVWDLRNMGALHRYQLKYTPADLSFSQKGLLAAGMGNVIEVYQDPTVLPVDKPYMRHRCRGRMSQVAFCPYEDFLGVASDNGFQSVLIPGSGEPNFDALESNPFQTKQQRREAEVKALLEKIQPELITLNTEAIKEVDVPSLQEKLEARQKLKFVKPPKVEWDKKRKGKGGPGAAVKVRRKLQEQSNKEFRRKVKELESGLPDDGDLSDVEEKDESKEIVEETKPAHVLDRFKPKKKTK
ncbi:WD repeat-containing protein 46 [Ischnura elegans]|uniref:WD repeat-containing protein 46 n=1 Tax=Ischnura elegans TaxID=197161 RepID=UPI001ED8892C|nr:WD repeat-containing protein 46 [Ischnura elegans]